MKPMGRPRVDPEIRFWAKVDADGDCWEWTGGISSNGYGVFAAGGRGGKNLNPHRYVWELLVGPIGAGLQIDHLCRNRRCVNPDHLEPVTPKTNFHRGFNPFLLVHLSDKCSNGHPFTASSTYLWNGQRKCRPCSAATQHRYMARKAAAS